jgi:acetyl-CoA acetyltransferase
MGVVARQLWRQAGAAPQDMRVAVLYDHFTPFVLLQLEELGFCPRGEARHFIAGGAIELGGRLPVNPHGGQLGEAYIHGVNGIAEAVRQVRGTSVNQAGGAGSRHGQHRGADQRPGPGPGLTLVSAQIAHSVFFFRRRGFSMKSSPGNGWATAA